MKDISTVSFFFCADINVERMKEELGSEYGSMSSQEFKSKKNFSEDLLRLWIYSTLCLELNAKPC